MSDRWRVSIYHQDAEAIYIDGLASRLRDAGLESTQATTEPGPPDLARSHRLILPSGFPLDYWTRHRLGAWQEDFDLGYLSMPESFASIQVLIRRFWDIGSRKMIVGDLMARLAEYVDWYEYFSQEDADLPAEIPDEFEPCIFGIESRRFVNIHERFSRYDLERRGQYVLATHSLAENDWESERTAQVTVPIFARSGST